MPMHRWAAEPFEARRKGFILDHTLTRNAVWAIVATVGEILPRIGYNGSVLLQKEQSESAWLI